MPSMDDLGDWQERQNRQQALFRELTRMSPERRAELYEDITEFQALVDSGYAAQERLAALRFEQQKQERLLSMSDVVSDANSAVNRVMAKQQSKDKQRISRESENASDALLLHSLGVLSENSNLLKASEAAKESFNREMEQGRKSGWKFR